MFSNLTNLFDESPEICILKSLSTVSHKKTQIIMTSAVFLTLLLSWTFKQSLYKFPNYYCTYCTKSFAG